MTEETVEQVEIPEPNGRPAAPENFIERLSALEEKANQVDRLQQRINELEAAARRAIGRDRARATILDLTGDLLEITGIPEDLEDEQLGYVNTALSRLGLDTLLRTFAVDVDFRLVPSGTVRVEVEAESFEDAATQIENGDFDDDIRDAIGVQSTDVEVEIVGTESGD